MSLIHTGIRHPTSVMKNVIPVVMAGGEQSISFFVYSLYDTDTNYFSNLYIVIGIYGLIVAVILAESITNPMQGRENTYSIYSGMAHVSKIKTSCCLK